MLLVILGLAAYVLNILASAGVFRKLEYQTERAILKKVGLPGAEDIMVSYTDSFAIVSSTERSSFPRLEQEKGGLYLIDLKSDDYAPILLTEGFDRPFAPHGISMYRSGELYYITAINHTTSGEFIEKFRLSKGVLTPIETYSDALMISPNDLVMINENQFYFTNDHKYLSGFKKFLEEYAGLKGGNVVFYDGKQFKIAAAKIAYANGINYSLTKDELYVSSPRNFQIYVFDASTHGTLASKGIIKCGTGIDNLELDEEGNLWTGAHPNLLRFKAYSTNKRETAPSEILKINYRSVEDYDIECLYLEDGSSMSGSSVAAPFGDKVLLGNVMDEEFLIIER